MSGHSASKSLRMNSHGRDFRCCGFTLVFLIASFPLILAASQETYISTQDVAQLAVNFFRRRRIRSIVVYACSDVGRRHILRAFATTGDFKTAAPIRPLNHSSVVLSEPAAGVLMWSVCPWARGILRNMRDEFNSSIYWLLVDDDGFIPEDAKLRLDTELTIARMNQNDSEIELWEAFRANPDDENVIRLVGVCPAASQCEISKYDPRKESLAVRRLGVHNVKVKPVLYMWKVWGPDIMNNLHEMSRDVAMQMHIISPMAMHGHIMFMNIVARYNMTVTELMSSEKPGQLDVPEGTPFNGAIGYVERGEADVDTGLVMSPDRHRVMVFSLTTWKLKTVCGFLSNSALGALDALAKPFHWSSWAGISVFGVLVFLLHKFVRKVEGSEEVTWSDVFISSFGTFTSQGFLGCGESLSCRFLLFVVEVFFYLSQAYYSAAIVIFLLRPPPSSIRTVHDLVESEYKGVAHDWIHTRRMIQNSTDPLVRDVYLKKIQEPKGEGFVPTNVGLVSLMVPWTAFFASDDVLYEAVSKLSDNEVCRFLEFGLDVPLFVAVAAAKNVSYKEWFHSAMALQVERGVADREQREWHFQRPACGGGAGAEDLSVGLTPIMPAVAALLFGGLLAFLLLAVERLSGTLNTRDELSWS